MLPRIEEQLTFTPVTVFDLVDGFAQRFGAPTTNPRPIGTVHFWIIGEMKGAVLKPFDPPWEMVVSQTPSGYYAFFGQVFLPGAMRRAQIKVPNGKYAVRVLTNYYQPLELTAPASLVEVPPPPPAPLPPAPPPAQKMPMRLEPSYTYPFPPTVRVATSENCMPPVISGQAGPTLLRGKVVDQQGKPVAGATVTVGGLVSPSYAATDESGQWVLWFEGSRPPGEVNLKISLGTASVDIKRVCVIENCETSIGKDVVLALP